MLAEGMVPDEDKRRRYLATLRAESERLTHLVENVLAYARLERGRARGRTETVTLGQLAAAAEPHLAERARQAGMELVVRADADASETAVRADASAVEQVLFNLVDNACKYAASAADRRIDLVADGGGDRPALKVCDRGPGVSRTDARRLFRPFSKSASKAAASAPGVRLGLALSRRLAREMGGDLVLESGPTGGACFALRLVRAT
jgi:signal transduction histidine kinase